MVGVPSPAASRRLRRYSGNRATVASGILRACRLMPLPVPSATAEMLLPLVHVLTSDAPGLHIYPRVTQRGAPTTAPTARAVTMPSSPHPPATSPAGGLPVRGLPVRGLPGRVAPPVLPATASTVPNAGPEPPPTPARRHGASRSGPNPRPHPRGRRGRVRAGRATAARAAVVRSRGATPARGHYPPAACASERERAGRRRGEPWWSEAGGWDEAAEEVLEVAGDRDGGAVVEVGGDHLDAHGQASGRAAYGGHRYR